MNNLTGDMVVDRGPWHVAGGPTIQTVWDRLCLRVNGPVHDGLYVLVRRAP